MRDIGISPTKKTFQRIMVNLQLALEDGLHKGLVNDENRVILCHRGSLDPLAYWLDRGWEAVEFFIFTKTTKEDHYRRYTAVIHLVTAADGAIGAYKRWPDAHRPETPEEAIQLDRLLYYVWHDHPNYYRIDNQGKNWDTKSREAHRLLRQILRNQKEEGLFGSIQ